MLRRLIRAKAQPEASTQSPWPEQPSKDGRIAATLREIVGLAAASRFAEAHDVAARALEATPGQPDLLFAKATALLDTGRSSEARALYEDLERSGHASTALAVQLATACHRLGDNRAAEAALRRAAIADPGGFGHRYALGALLQTEERFEEAIPEIEAAIAIDARHADARIAHGNALMEVKRYAEGEAAYRQAAELVPHSPAAWTNVGFALMRQDRFAEAHAVFERALRLEEAHGGDVDAFNNYAAALGDDMRDDLAIEVSERSLPARPAPKAHYNYAISLLRSGRLAEGWCQYESRWLFEPFRSLRPVYGVPAWSGQSLDGKTIILRAEQGLGDTIQMLRYVPALAALGARVLLRAPPGLARVGMAVEGMAEVLEQGAPNPPFDFFAQAMSLPGVFGTTLDSIPNDVPYLSVDPARRSRWKARLGPKHGPRVGLVWAGSPDHIKDRYRSLHLEALAPLLAVDGVEFVSLQKGPPSDELAAWSSRAKIIGLGPELDDLADTAAVIEQLDLVVGVDTAVMHLAGALARPVWMMVPLPCDWRWLANRDDSPWYPTMRLYRQTVRNRWDDVIARVAGDVAAWAAGEIPEALPSVPAPRANVARLLGARMGPARTVAVPGMCAITETRWGVIQYPEDGSDTATSLAVLGEWLEPQARLLSRMLKADSIVVEMSPGVGCHTLAFATVLKKGRVYACEPAPVARRLLRQNVEANGLTNVVILASDPSRAADIPAESIDAMRLERLDLLKVSAPERSMRVLHGASDMLWRARPIMLLSVASTNQLAVLVEHVKQFGYRCWDMRVPLFSTDNFNRRESDIFAGRMALALLAIPEETDVEMQLPGCTPIA